MGKFFKGFFIGSLTAGVITLLTTKTSGKENRAYAKAMIEQGKEFTQHIATTKAQIGTLQTHVLPHIQETTKEVQQTLLHFSQENQPRIKRVTEKLQTLQRHIKHIQKKETENDVS